jgi:hypothetical protein
MAEGIADGELFLPIENTPEPFIDTDDIAEVVVTVLSDINRQN